MTTSPRFQLGSSYATLVSLSDWKIVDPMPDYSPYSKEVPLEGLGVIGRGPATAVWSWSFIPFVLADNLRDYRTGTTTRDLFIRTWVPQRNAYVPFLVDMVWPKSEKSSCGKLFAFSLSFVNLIEVAELEA